MTKADTIKALVNAYRVGNASDSDQPETWTHPRMAARFCRALDEAFAALRECSVLTGDEVQEIYDTL